MATEVDFVKMANRARYQEYLDSDEWKARSERILVSSNWECQQCHKYEATQVHHLTYARVGNELDEDLIALCSRCHRHQHIIYP